jgi:hypothetical protein
MRSQVRKRLATSVAVAQAADRRLEKLMNQFVAVKDNGFEMGNNIFRAT